ncbi:hypothetical protein KC352_g41634, partial [Hortaea werneckii]
HLAVLAPPVFASVRDPVIPVKLAAEAAFLSLFDLVEQDKTVFDAFMAGPGGKVFANPAQKRSLVEYTNRIGMRLAAQARERKEAEGGGSVGALGLSADEVEDEKEVMSIGRVELEGGEGEF